MKQTRKFLFKLVCVALAVAMVVLLCACSDCQSEKVSGKTEDTTAEQTTAPSAVTEVDLTALHNVKSTDSKFSGYWQITDGTGSQLEHFVFMFDGKGKAYLLVGTMGYIGTYSETTEEGESIFKTQLVFGLDGSYTYTFSDDNKTVELVNKEDNSATTMKKLDSFSSVPTPSGNEKTEETMLGAWCDDTGEYLYFGENGIFYDCQKDFSFTFYTYSASNGKISMKYTMTEEYSDSAEYEINGDVLTYNHIDYKRIATDELV